MATGGDGESESGQLPRSSLGDDDALWTDVHVYELFGVVQVRQSLHDLLHVHTNHTKGVLREEICRIFMIGTQI